MTFGLVLFFSGYSVPLGFVNTDGGVFRDKNGDLGVSGMRRSAA